VTKRLHAAQSAISNCLSKSFARDFALVRPLFGLGAPKCGVFSSQMLSLVRGSAPLREPTAFQPTNRPLPRYPFAEQCGVSHSRFDLVFAWQKPGTRSRQVGNMAAIIEGFRAASIEARWIYRCRGWQISSPSASTPVAFAESQSLPHHIAMQQLWGHTHFHTQGLRNGGLSPSSFAAAGFRSMRPATPS